MTPATEANTDVVKNLPGSERSILLVATDEKYEKLKISNQKIPYIHKVPLVGVLGRKAIQTLLVLEKNVGFQHRFRDRIERFRADWGDLKLMRITPPDATEFFTFLNPPIDGSVYRLNPFNERQYLEPASYTEHVAREKVGAFIRVSSTLGAKQIRLMNINVERSWWSYKTSSRNVAAQIGICAEFGDENRMKQTVYAEFDRPEKSPFIPEELENWVDSVPEMRTLAKNRLDGKPKRLVCELVIAGSSKMEEKFIAQLLLADLNVGGKHCKLARSIWKFDIEFWQ